jgi:septum formation protein
MKQLGLDFRVVPATVDERNNRNLMPEEYVMHCARAKAESLSGQVSSEDIVIGADTVVVLDGVTYGKPTDEAEARKILALLSGRTHRVLSAIAVVANGICKAELVETKVTLSEITAKQIDRYVKTGEPLDKAGAYAVQGLGAIFVERIDGCFFNVVGLPLHALARSLSTMGVGLP